jgi:nucleoside 2-deoxyribosyltransferase
MTTVTNASTRAFVAMSFDASMNDAWYKGFEPAIRSWGFKAIRIDKEDYAGGIVDRIMAEIRNCNFVVADYTMKNNGVYFEAGFTLGLGRTVIPTCRTDHIGDLHFDIRHLNTLP